MVLDRFVAGAEAVFKAPYVPELIGGGLVVLGTIAAFRGLYNYAFNK